MAVFQLPTDGIADGAITTAKINASVSLGASVNVILEILTELKLYLQF